MTIDAARILPPDYIEDALDEVWHMTLDAAIEAAERGDDELAEALWADSEAQQEDFHRWFPYFPQRY